MLLLICWSATMQLLFSYCLYILVPYYRFVCFDFCWLIACLTCRPRDSTVSRRYRLMSSKKRQIIMTIILKTSKHIRRLSTHALWRTHTHTHTHTHDFVSRHDMRVWVLDKVMIVQTVKNQRIYPTPHASSFIIILITITLITIIPSALQKLRTAAIYQF